jgi:hypothetical protein
MMENSRIANSYAIESWAAVFGSKHATFKPRLDVPTILQSRTQAVSPTP